MSRKVESNSSAPLAPSIITISTLRIHPSAVREDPIEREEVNASWQKIR